MTADNDRLPVAVLLHASVRLHLLGIILVTLVAVVVVVHLPCSVSKRNRSACGYGAL